MEEKIYKRIPDEIFARASEFAFKEAMPVLLTNYPGEVVGEIVDEENYLIYVVRNNDQITMVYSSDVKAWVTELAGHTRRKVKRITFAKPLS